MYCVRGIAVGLGLAAVWEHFQAGTSLDSLEELTL